MTGLLLMSTRVSASRRSSNYFKLCIRPDLPVPFGLCFYQALLSSLIPDPLLTDQLPLILLYIMIILKGKTFGYALTYALCTTGPKLGN